MMKRQRLKDQAERWLLVHYYPSCRLALEPDCYSDIEAAHEVLQLQQMENVNHKLAAFMRADCAKGIVSTVIGPH